MATKQKGRVPGHGTRAQKSVLDRDSSSKSQTATSKRALTGDVLPPRDIKEWAALINAAWRKSVESIIETGRLLIDAKAAMPGKFHLMLKDKLLFDVRTAQKLMEVASNPILSDASRVTRLPPHWSTLHVLAGLPPEKLERLIEEGTVNANMERADAEALVRVQHVSVQVVHETEHIAVPYTASDPKPLTEPLAKAPEPERSNVHHLAARSAWTRPSAFKDEEEPEQARPMALRHVSGQALRALDAVVSAANHGQFDLGDLEEFAVDVTSKVRQLDAVIEARRRAGR